MYLKLLEQIGLEINPNLADLPGLIWLVKAFTLLIYWTEIVRIFILIKLYLHFEIAEKDLIYPNVFFDLRELGMPHNNLETEVTYN